MGVGSTTWKEEGGVGMERRDRRSLGFTEGLLEYLNVGVCVCVRVAITWNCLDKYVCDVCEVVDMQSIISARSLRVTCANSGT